MSWSLTKQNRPPTPTRPTPAKQWTSCRTIRQLSPSCKTLTRTAALHPADINCGITAERINGFARNGHFRNIFTQGLHASMKALRPTDAMCHITSATEIYVFNPNRSLDRNRRVIREYVFLFHSSPPLFRHLAAVRVSP